MKKYTIMFLTVIICLLLAGCGDDSPHIGEARTPSGSSIMKGKNYLDVIERFEEKGFTNIKTEKIEDLIIGWLTKDGEVESVSVGGDIDYSSDKWVPADTEVIITYHTFAADKTEEESEADEEPSSSLNEVIDNDTVLTVDNCEDLANMFSKPADYSRYADFAEKYSGRIIEFDGSIDYVVNSIIYNPFDGSSKEVNDHHDFLLSYGDFDPDIQIGPTIRLEEVSNYALGLKLFDEWPNHLNVGSNVHIKVKVLSFNEDTGLFNVEYESIDPR